MRALPWLITVVSQLVFDIETIYQRKYRRPMSSERVEMIINSLGVETLGVVKSHGICLEAGPIGKNQYQYSISIQERASLRSRL